MHSLTSDEYRCISWRVRQIASGCGISVCSATAMEMPGYGKHGKPCGRLSILPAPVGNPRWDSHITKAAAVSLVKTLCGRIGERPVAKATPILGALFGRLRPPAPYDGWRAEFSPSCEVVTSYQAPKHGPRHLKLSSSPTSRLTASRSMPPPICIRVGRLTTKLAK